MTTTDATPKPVNFLVNFWDIITAPRLALRRVSSVQTRSWWFPVLLSLATPLIYVALTLNLQIAEVKKTAALRLSAMTPEQADAARPMLERMTQPNALLLTTATQVALGLLVAWAIGMLIFYFGIALMGTSVKPQALWAALAWTWTPFALRPLVQLAWSLYSGSLVKYPGLSYFFASGQISEDQRNPLFLATAQMDLFGLWHLALIYLLLRVVGKLGAGGSLFLTLLYAAIQIGYHMIPAALAQLTSIG